MKKGIKKKFYLWLNRVHLNFHIKREGKFFKIFVSEKNKKAIKAIKYALTIIGLVSAFFTFASSIYAFLFAVVLFIVLSILEKIIFSYANLFISPLPEFELENEKWLGVSFGYAKDPNSKEEIPVVGMVFSDQTYAKKIYSLLMEWNYDQYKDSKNNICMSVILDEEDYVFFCYPNMERETSNRFFEECAKERKEKTPKDVQMKHYCALTLGKRCKITPSSYLPTFAKRYTNGVPFLFQVQFTPDSKPGGLIEEVEGTKNILKFDLKIKNKTELTRKDLEYDLIRMGA